MFLLGAIFGKVMEDSEAADSVSRWLVGKFGLSSKRIFHVALALGSVTFTMTSAGSPEIQNWIPIEYLKTSPYAGWEVSILVAVFMAVFGYW